MKYLINKAKIALKNAYAPYSKFYVGCSLEMKDGTIFLGSNVENISYGGTICAERSAIVAAISNGYKKKDFKAIAIVANTNKYIRPCFICRQTFVEFFDKDMKIVLGKIDDDFEILRIGDLIPYPFENFQ
ncbi:MAG: cytidine deaminase [Bacilli bacterium]